MLQARISPTVAGIAFLFLILGPRVSAGDKSELEERIITDVIMAVDAISAKGVPMDRGPSSLEERTTSKYWSFKKNKALAACVAWKASRSGHIVVRTFGGQVEMNHVDTAAEMAMSLCQKFRATDGVTDCECAVVAKNHDLVLDIPDSFLSRISRPFVVPSIEDVDAVPYIGKTGREAYKDFLRTYTDRVFAISPDGAWAWRASRLAPMYELTQQALRDCQSRTNERCFLYAINDKVVWEDQ